MTNEELNTALYQKMFDEQERFRDELLSMSPAEVLDHAYEYTVREDLLLTLEYHDLEDGQAKALLKLKEPLKNCSHSLKQVKRTIWIWCGTQLTPIQTTSCLLKKQKQTATQGR